MSINQLSFFPEENADTILDQIEACKTKISNIRAGLFKRQEQEKKALDFLENEVEDLLKKYLYLFEEPHGYEPISANKGGTSNKIYST